MKVFKYIRLIFFPVSIIYGIVIRVRNYLFDIGKLKSNSYAIPIISVGNITVGGTGKTPLTEFIIETLNNSYKVALLSRGYKRKTKGVITANSNSTAYDIGDEPFQIKSKFDKILVTVAEKRVLGIDSILNNKPKPDVIVMDDAYQHRYVTPGFSLLVMDYNRPLWKDFMLPAGELREPASGKKRANIIIVSKCPENLSENKQSNIIKKLKITPDQSVYFSSIAYKKPIALFCSSKSYLTEELKDYEVLVVTGIANPTLFVNYIDSHVKKANHLSFKDHHMFSNDDIEIIKNRFKNITQEKKIILTTEKDAVRLKHIINKNDEVASFIFYIPIHVELLNQQNEELRERILFYVRENAASSQLYSGED